MTCASPVAPRRSCLSVPGSSCEMLAKARGLPADELIIDLEDAVATTEKDVARRAVVELLRRAAWAGSAVSVRINGPRSPWCHQDVCALAELDRQPSTIVVPKVESAGDMAFVDRLLDGAEAAGGRAHPLRVQALIETPAALMRVNEIAGASSRLCALILGYADLAALLGRTATGRDDLEVWRFAQELVLCAARAHGLQAIDGPHLGVAADAAFTEATQRAREVGFDGKWAIHPSQLQELNAAFTPSPGEIAHARKVIAVLKHAAASKGAGATQLDGRMLDAALGSAAMRTLARAGEHHTKHEQA